jgi:hypothetical protein
MRAGQQNQHCHSHIMLVRLVSFNQLFMLDFNVARPADWTGSPRDAGKAREPQQYTSRNDSRTVTTGVRRCLITAKLLLVVLRFERNVLSTVEGHDGLCLGQTCHWRPGKRTNSSRLSDHYQFTTHLQHDLRWQSTSGAVLCSCHRLMFCRFVQCALHGCPDPNAWQIVIMPSYYRAEHHHVEKCMILQLVTTARLCATTEWHEKPKNPC